MNARTSPVRRGFSLLEVLLALSILTGAIAVLGELTRIGSRNATAARNELTAQMLCETKLGEIACRPRPIEEAAERPLEGRRGWLYAVTVLPLEQPGLVSVEVMVRQDLPLERRPIEYRLTRWFFQGNSSPAGMPGDTTNPNPMPMPTESGSSSFGSAAAGIPQ